MEVDGQFDAGDVDGARASFQRAIEVSDRIACLYLGRMAAQITAKDVTSNQVVELITAGYSGDIGLPPSVAKEAVAA